MTDDQPIKDMMMAMPKIRGRVRDRDMRLPNAYVSESSRCPSRASILRNRYPHNTGVARNGPPEGGVQTFRAFEGIGLRMHLGTRLLELVVNKLLICGMCQFLPIYRLPLQAAAQAVNSPTVREEAFA
jgi:hypothetical protein